MRRFACLAAVLVLATTGEARAASTDESAPIVEAICGARAKGRSCACPSYTEQAGVGELHVKSIRPGAFTGARQEEAVVEIEGCESGASTSLSYGSRALVRRTTAGWKRVSYAMGALGACTPVVPVAGIERLVCRVFSGHMGLYRETVSLIGWASRSGSTVEESQEIVEYWTGMAGGRLRVLRTKRFEVRGKDAALRIEMDVETDGALMPLRFAFDGTRFSVTPESRPALTLLQRLGGEP
jgi:hypothetical protein